MAQGRKSTGPGGLSAETVLLFTGIGLFAVAAGTIWIALKLAAAVQPGAEGVLGDPIATLTALINGEIHWSSTATAVLVAEFVLLVLLAVLGRYLVLRLKNKTSRVDRSASLMSTRNEIHRLTGEGAQRIADRLAPHAGPGVPIGRTVRDNLELFGSWEDMHVDIWGPRTGKTSARAVPAILDAPGAVIATSNKRDLVDITRNQRARRGPVWVFDPQDVCGEQPTWWWNPLSYVTDEVKARQLAGHFVEAQRSQNTRTDAYFDAAGTDLLAGMLLAAAVADRPITQIYNWLTDQRNDEPERILRATPHLQLSAHALSGVINAPDKQRAGIYGTAQQSAQFLVNRSLTRWVVPDGSPRPQFDPHRFVREGRTLYSLSKEGIGTAGPLVTALTVAVVEAAEDYAKTCAQGRMPTPFLGVLDEAANVCRWRDLPDLYSHFGSRGIILMTFLQSWAQGVECWGERGMEKLWSAANIRVYGGGVPDATFLERLSKLIGDYDIVASSVSYTKGQRTLSKQTQRHHIFDVSDLAALPPGRAILFPSGAPATLIKTTPWMTRPNAPQPHLLAEYRHG